MRTQVGPWLAEHVDIREAINTRSSELDVQVCACVCARARV